MAARRIPDPKVGGSTPSGLIHFLCLTVFETQKTEFTNQDSEVAQWKRVGLITQRSEDRNLASLCPLGAVGSA